MEIKIHKDVKLNLSDNEYKYLRLLEFYDDFISEIEKIIRQIKENHKRLFVDTLIPILKKYNIPITLIDSIESLILYGKILHSIHPIIVFDIRAQFNRRMLYNEDIDDHPHPNKLMEKEKWDLWYEQNKRITHDKGIEFALPLIKIHKRLNQTELIKYIKLKWNEIEEAFNHYEKSDGLFTEFKRISFSDIEKMIKIYRLRREGKKSLDIGLELNLATQTVRQYSSRMKKLLISLGFLKK